MLKLFWMPAYAGMTILLLSLAGCSILSPVKTAQTHTYLLNTTPPSINYYHYKTSNTILVEPVQSAPAYNTTDIAYTTQPYQIAYFVNNHWAETPAQMLQPLIIQTLQNTQHFRAVVSSAVASHYDVALHTQLLKLQQDFSQHPSRVDLTLRAQLINNSNNQVIATRQFTITKTAPQDNPYGGVIAANQAVAELLQQLGNLIVKSSLK